MPHSIKLALEAGQLINSIPISSTEKGDQGFTLIESLIAIILLGIILTGGLAFYFYSNALYYRGLHLQLATWLADSKMEDCKSLGAGSIPGGVCSAEENTSLSKVIQGLDAKRSTSVNTIAGTSYKDVSVSISWREPGDGADRTVNLRTYVGS